ncbi:MAG: hypothetical protein QOH46_3949 [Solirubrobacteraceae bacterium]|nr:hypothetical protein [Solirubrobacteraceae bacterium]
MRMGGSSIAAPGAAAWITDFLNAAYYVRPADARDVADLRLAHGILNTYWARRSGRRLGARDVPAFHRAFGAMRRRSGGLLDRDALLRGAVRLLGEWFPDAWHDPRRRAHGIAFPTEEARHAYDPSLRLSHGRLGPLDPPREAPGERPWSTYPPVALPNPDAALRLLADPARWPDIGSAGGHFTAVRAGELLGTTFEIDVSAALVPRAPIFTRAYVTCTELHGAGRLLAEVVRTLDRHVPGAFPECATPILLIQLTSHSGHFLGRALSHLVVFEQDGLTFIRDVGSWDSLPPHLATAYAAAGRDAQATFWGPEPEELSVLAQLARVTSGAA